MKLGENITINCHSSICINENIYFDPFNINEGNHNAMVIFITHSHFDHLELSSIEKIINYDTVIVCTQDSAKILKEAGIDNEIVVVKPNQKLVVKNIEIETFPAYNVGHHHLKDLGFVGFNVIIDNVKYTICGDTDATDELKQVKTDVLLVPIGGTYTMNPKEAGSLTNIIRPQLVIPTHYNLISGTLKKYEAESEFLETLDRNINVKFLINFNKKKKKKI